MTAPVVVVCRRCGAEGQGVLHSSGAVRRVVSGLAVGSDPLGGWRHRGCAGTIVPGRDGALGAGAEGAVQVTFSGANRSGGRDGS